MPIQVTPFQPEQTDAIGTLAKVLQIKNMQGQGQLQQQGIEQNALQLDAQKQQQAEQQTIMRAQIDAGGDPRKFLPALKGRINPQTYSVLEQQDAKTRKELADADSSERKSLQAKNDQFLALIKQSQTLPDEIYNQSWPQILQTAEQIHPGTAQKYGLSPDKPVPKEQLAQFELGMITADQYFKQANEEAGRADKRKHDVATEEHWKNQDKPVD